MNKATARPQVEPPTPTIKKRATSMSMVFFKADDVYWVLQIVSLVLIGLTVIVGGFAILAGVVAGQNQAREMLLLQKDLAEAKTSLAKQQERAANAEADLEMLRKRQDPRSFSFDSVVFADALKDKAKGTVEIIFEKDNAEAFDLARQLNVSLVMAGWNVPSRPRPAEPSKDPRFASDPPISLLHGYNGFAVITKEMDGKNMSAPFWVLVIALVKAQNGLWYNGYAAQDSSLPDNSFRIVIGPKDSTPMARVVRDQ